MVTSDNKKQLVKLSENLNSEIDSEVLQCRFSTLLPMFLEKNLP